MDQCSQCNQLNPFARLASHRAIEWALYFATGITVGILLYIDSLVWFSASCEQYLHPVNRWLANTGGLIGLVSTAVLLLLHVFAQIRVRRYRRLIIDTALIAVIIAVAYISFQTTFLHCWLHGADLPPCLFGCAH